MYELQRDTIKGLQTLVREETQSSQSVVIEPSNEIPSLLLQLTESNEKIQILQSQLNANDEKIQLHLVESKHLEVIVQQLELQQKDHTKAVADSATILQAKENLIAEQHLEINAIKSQQADQLTAISSSTHVIAALEQQLSEGTFKKELIY